jgi:hypothetical protein
LEDTKQLTKQVGQCHNNECEREDQLVVHQAAPPSQLATW